MQATEDKGNKIFQLCYFFQESTSCYRLLFPLGDGCEWSLIHARVDRERHEVVVVRLSVVWPRLKQTCVQSFTSERDRDKARDRERERERERDRQTDRQTDIQTEKRETESDRLWSRCCVCAKLLILPELGSEASPDTSPVLGLTCLMTSSSISLNQLTSLCLQMASRTVRCISCLHSDTTSFSSARLSSANR